MRFASILLLLSFVLTIGLTGCAKLGPEFTKPSAPLGDGWYEQHESASTQGFEHGKWWETFDDPILHELIKKATGGNLSLQIAGVRIFEARAQLGVATGNLYPQTQQASGGLSHIELSDNLPNGSPLADTGYRDVDVGFDAAWELDLWGKFRRGVESADASLLAEVANFDDALVSITAEVANIYIAIRTFEARLKIAADNVNTQQRSLDIATIRHREGAASGLDVEQARTLLEDTRASIPSLEIGLRQAQNALNILLGLPPREISVLHAQTGVIPTINGELTLGMPADLLTRRPDIRVAALQAAAQSARIGIAEADLYPQLSLVGTVGLRSGDTGSTDLSDVFEGGSLQASVGPSFRWNILNYGRVKNSVRLEDARYQRALINYQTAVLNAANEVEDSVVAYVRGKNRVRHLAASVESAARAVELALIQYRDGAVDYTRVLDTQTALLRQSDAYTDAQGRVVRDLIATYKALGGGWQIRAETGVLPSSVAEEMRQRTDWGKILETSAPQIPETQLRKPDW